MIGNFLQLIFLNSFQINFVKGKLEETAASACSKLNAYCIMTKVQKKCFVSLVLYIISIYITQYHSISLNITQYQFRHYEIFFYNKSLYTSHNTNNNLCLFHLCFQHYKLKYVLFHISYIFHLYQ